jgi:hypothetical protein
LLGDPISKPIAIEVVLAERSSDEAAAPFYRALDEILLSVRLGAPLCRSREVGGGVPAGGVTAPQSDARRIARNQREMHARCETAGVAGAERSEGNLAASATVMGRLGS